MQAWADSRQRLLAFSSIALAVGAGMLGFRLGGAPSGYIVVNGLALLVPAVFLLPPGAIRLRAIAPAFTLAAIILLATALWLGPSVEGVRRWIPLGPLQLHAGMLVIPGLAAVLMRQRETISLAATALCAVIIWQQPDFATALALFAGIAAASFGRKLVWAEQVMRLVATIGLVLVAFQPDPLAEVRFVETAMGDGLALSPLLGIGLGLGLFFAILLPPWLLTRNRPEMIPAARAITGALAGFAIAGLVAPFPQPLVGYGAAPIIGYGLALAVLRFSR